LKKISIRWVYYPYMAINCQPVSWLGTPNCCAVFCPAIAAFHWHKLSPFDAAEYRRLLRGAWIVV